MTQNYIELLKLQKQIERVTPGRVRIKNPYQRIINRLAPRFDPRLVTLYNKLLYSLVKLQHLYNYKSQLLVSRQDLLITLSLMQNLLKPVSNKPICSDNAFYFYEKLYQALKTEQLEEFSMKQALLLTKTPRLTARTYLIGLESEGLIQREKKRRKVGPGRYQHINIYRLSYTLNR